jgi:hypothetical protein
MEKGYIDIIIALHGNTGVIIYLGKLDAEAPP